MSEKENSLHSRLAERFIACGGIAALSASMLVGVSISRTPDSRYANSAVEQQPSIATANVESAHEDIQGAITWNDDENAAGIRPDVVNVQLVDDDGNIVAQSETSAESSWQYAFANVETSDASGNPIAYHISSDSVQPYVTENNGYSMVNTYSASSIAVAVNIIWDDDDDRDALRPDSVEVELSRENDNAQRKVTITADDDWSYTFTDVASRADNKRQGWVAAEFVDPCTNHEYSISVLNDGTNVEDQTVTIRNYHKPYQTYITINNIWEDEANERGIRPEKVAMTVLGSDGSERQIELTKDDAIDPPVADDAENDDGAEEPSDDETDESGEDKVVGGTAITWRKTSDEPLYRFDHGEEIEYTVVSDSIEVFGENAELYDNNYDFIADVEEEYADYEIRYSDEGDELTEGYKQLAEEAPKYKVTYSVNIDDAGKQVLSNAGIKLASLEIPNFANSNVTLYAGDTIPAAPSLTTGFNRLSEQIKELNPDLTLSGATAWGKVATEISAPVARQVTWTVTKNEKEIRWMFVENSSGKKLFIIGRPQNTKQYTDPDGKVFTILDSGEYNDIYTSDVEKGGYTKEIDKSELNSMLPPWNNNANIANVKEVRVDTPITPIVMYNWFAGFEKVTKVNLYHCDLKSCTNMRDAFFGCTSLSANNITWYKGATADLNVPKLQTLRGAFWQCTNFSSDDDNSILKVFRNAPKLVSMRGMLAKTIVTDAMYKSAVSFDTSKLEKLADIRQMFQAATGLQRLNIIGALNGRSIVCYRLTFPGTNNGPSWTQTKVYAPASWRTILTEGDTTRLDYEPATNKFVEWTPAKAQSVSFFDDIAAFVFGANGDDAISIPQQQTRYSKSGFVVHHAGESADKGQGRTLGDKKLTLTVHHRIKKIEGAPVVAPVATVMPPEPVVEAVPQAPEPVPEPAPVYIEPEAVPAAVQPAPSPIAAAGDSTILISLMIFGTSSLLIGLWMAYRHKQR